MFVALMFLIKKGARLGVAGLILAVILITANISLGFCTNCGTMELLLLVTSVLLIIKRRESLSKI